MSILNPGHGSNTSNAIGLCTPATGRVFISKSVFQYDVSLPTGVSSISFFNTPFFEYPVGMYLDGQMYLIPNPNYNESLMGDPSPVNYLRNHAVYGVTPIGISQTIDQVSSAMDQKGIVTTARKPCDVDYQNISTTSTMLPTTTTNQKVIQSFPTTVNDLTRLAGSIDVRKSDKGAYLISHHQSFNTVYRKEPWNKCAVYTNRPTSDCNSFCLASSPQGTNISVFAYFAANDKSTYATPSMILPLDMPIAMFTDCKVTDGSTTAFRIKVACSYQFDLKLNSDLYPYTVDRPIADVEFMNYIWAFEGMMTGGGFPADYNFWDKLWPMFKTLWKGGGSDLIRKIPKAGGVIGDVGDLITNLF